MVNHEAELYFRDRFREARASAFRDAEGFQEILFALEALGMLLIKKGIGLNAYSKRITVIAKRSPLAFDMPEAWHIGFDDLYELVRNSRNDAMHQGAYARQLTNHAVQLALVLEDALVTGSICVSDFMVKDPTTAFPWQPVSFVRQVMLSNSYSYLPIWVEIGNYKPDWYLLSEFNVASYLRCDGDKSRNSRLAKTVEEAVCLGELILQKANCCLPELTIIDALADFDHGPLLVIHPEDKKRLLGLLTAFDLL